MNSPHLFSSKYLQGNIRPVNLSAIERLTQNIKNLTEKGKTNELNQKEIRENEKMNHQSINSQNVQNLNNIQAINIDQRLNNLAEIIKSTKV